MADTKITDLTELAAGALAVADVFPVVDVDAGVTKKIKAQNILPNVTVLNEQTTGDFPPNADQELVFKNSEAGANVLAVQNDATDGFSAYTVRTDGGHEKMAMGWGNSGGGSYPFTGACYIEVWTGVASGGTPPAFKLMHDGDFGAVGSGFRYYCRLSLEETTSDFVIWKLIPHTSTQERALTIPAATGSVVVGNAALATDATDGFLYIPTCNGTPTGTPTGFTGRVPMVYDSANNKLYIYSGGAWRDMT